MGCVLALPLLPFPLLDGLPGEVVVLAQVPARRSSSLVRAQVDVARTPGARERRARIGVGLRGRPVGVGRRRRKRDNRVPRRVIAAAVILILRHPRRPARGHAGAMPLLSIHRRMHALCTFPPHPPRHHHTFAPFEPVGSRAPGATRADVHPGQARDIRRVLQRVEAHGTRHRLNLAVAIRRTNRLARHRRRRSSSVPRAPPVAARYASRTAAAASSALCARVGVASIFASSDWRSATWHKTRSSRWTPRTLMYTHKRCLQM